MPKTIIADTSCFIVLSNIHELDLLRQVYGSVLTTPEIVDEFGAPLPDWVKITTIRNTHVLQILELQIDKRESSAITLALEIQNSLLILDDIKARKIAQQLHINMTGTIGVIIKAKLNGNIASVTPIFSKMKSAGFYLSPELEAAAKTMAKEQ